MCSGASRVQLSAISSEALWEQSGRLSKIGSEVCSSACSHVLIMS